MKPTLKLFCATALLLGCNIDLSGANINAKADVNANVKINNGPQGGGPSGPSGIQDVVGLEIQADTETLAWGALGPFDKESDQYPGYQNPGGGPVPYPTPAAVSDPRPMRSQFANFRVFATVRNGGSAIEVPPDDPGFNYQVDPKVPVDLRMKERIISPVAETPPGQLTLRVSWGDVSAARTFQVVGGGAADVVAE
ncbi:MAG: hypothetical protein FJZ01_24150 [Candidatus Sericytochromatia bacterium]|nr:hypothetical protein [Candidatus Tanganyikabacteria bacterium]